ncbi:PleD family two-component system response regulator [Ferruginibacter sp. HRS2-29]|uniref:response regulator n=1 Tax=Ferruginibacter sp. HRS2-29 TaxID=2487334 RepID=UPI0020CD0801|nr:response regulator [Ferruginibacter sp. HRS2-29]MCP9753426.1 DNA-binding response regulator [Ferruginibacter sp. HRS2-29]
MKNKQIIDVLVIDDDPDLCLLMESLLKFAGHDVQRMTNPVFLEEKLSQVMPRVILMDMLLSGSDGREICTALKANEATKDIPVMMISAHPDAEISCREAGADDFLGKPFDMDIFLDRVGTLVEKRKKEL